MPLRSYSTRAGAGAFRLQARDDTDKRVTSGKELGDRFDIYDYIVSGVVDVLQRN